MLRHVHCPTQLHSRRRPLCSEGGTFWQRSRPPGELERMQRPRCCTGGTGVCFSPSDTGGRCSVGNKCSHQSTLQPTVLFEGLVKLAFSRIVKIVILRSLGVRLGHCRSFARFVESMKKRLQQPLVQVVRKSWRILGPFGFTVARDFIGSFLRHHVAGRPGCDERV